MTKVVRKIFNVITGNHAGILLLVILSFLINSLGIPQTTFSIDSLKKLLDNTNKLANAKILSNIADHYQKAEKYREAIDFHEKALGIYRLKRDTVSEADALYEIGRCYSLVFVFDISTGYLIKALERYERNNNLQGASQTLNSLGINYNHCLNKGKALESYLKSYKISIKIKDERTSANVLNNIGTIYLTGFKNYPKALYYLEKSFALSQKIDDSTRSIQLENIALAYMGMKKYSAALQYLRMSLNLSEQFKSKLGMASNYCNIANLYLKINKPDKAKQYLDRSLNISREIDSQGLIRVAYNLYTLYYAIKGDIDKMWDYADKSDEITDTLYNDEGKKLIAEMQTKYETEKKEQEIKILSVENKLNESKLRTRSFLLLGLALAFIFIIVFIIQKRSLFFAHRNLVQKNLEIVESENKLGALVENVTLSESATIDSQGVRTIKYISSQLTEEQKIQIKGLIIRYFNSSKNFLHQNYSIHDLANDLEINRNYVSQVINEKFSKNFSSLLNEYRIREARKILSESSNYKFTIESIAESVGYKSKTTFNNAFKKFVGVTPSFYLNSMKKTQG
ncbi:MAG: tetratricopeptide repeat protein [Bacteroidales bacterium]|jgi:AraC-like DNA-binding protein|nr:tetratricopeptide repeat protein [Bacteroidales bacterium]